MNFKKYHVSKNLFDLSKIDDIIGLQKVDNSLIITTGETITVSSGKTLRQIIGTVSQGNYSLNAISTGSRKYIYLSIVGETWSFGASKTFTADNIDSYLDSSVSFYASGKNDTATITDIMLNEGSTALPYEPYSSEVWHDIPYYTHKTATDTLTTLPAVLYPTDTTATVGLKGNMQQSGTPTPTAPIQPSETGERTNNLFDISAVTLGKYINTSGEETASSGTGENVLNHSDYISINALTTYTFKCDKVAGYYGTSNAFCWFDSSKQLISRTLFTAEESGTEILGVDTAPSGAAYLIMNYRGRHGDTAMLNTGSTPLPYEPFGYKIPISSANTTTPVYLGEIQSTRQIKKLVLTGGENFNELAAGLYRITENGYMRSADTLVGMCSHFGGGYTVAAVPSAQQDTLSFLVSASGNNYVYFSPSQYLTISDFKTYLQQQYANGTPVTVWYVLATSTTGIVNEPLRKIGTYADEVSGITIPTIAGANAIDVDTTLKPSEVSVNYHGWHPVANVHERENGAWD